MHFEMELCKRKEAESVKNLQTTLLQGFADMAKKACFDSAGSASRASICEPEMPAEVKEWKKNHVSLMEKLTNLF